MLAEAFPEMFVLPYLMSPWGFIIGEGCAVPFFGPSRGFIMGDNEAWGWNFWGLGFN